MGNIKNFCDMTKAEIEEIYGTWSTQALERQDVECMSFSEWTVVGLGVLIVVSIGWAIYNRIK